MNIARYKLFEKVGNIGRSNEILAWEGVGNRQLFAFLKCN
jgi:hypothetical protein